MSENNENLNEVFEEEMDDASVITVPIDDTLSNSGEAADAKAVGDALDLKADRSELQAAITVNGQGADAQGAILIDGTDIPVNGLGETTIAEAVEEVAARTAEDIPMSGESGAQTIAEAISEAGSAATADLIPMGPNSEVTIAEKIATMDVVAGQNSTDITALKAKAGDTLMLVTGGSETIAQAVAERVRTVNGLGPDSTGNVQVTHALTADNLTSAQSQSSVGEWTRRTSGGTASIADGDAWLSGIRGNRTHVGYIPETLTMAVNAAPREQGEDPITATIDRDVFVEYVSQSGTINLAYTTSWSADPALYGVTVSGTPVAGDQITITYVKEDRGTIIQSDPQYLSSTGYNLYNHSLGYCVALKYSSEYGFIIAGTYTAVKYSSTISGDKSVITPVDGYFDIPANGYIWVEGGSEADTEVYMTWADWAVSGRTCNFAPYTVDEIDLTYEMGEYFPYGLLRVGDVRDEIDLNTGLAISNVERLAYTAENVEAAEASGRTWEADTNYIYLERETPVTHDIDIDGQYTVSDHGLEMFTGTTVPVYTIIIYGNNLKNKLERDVLTRSTDLANNLTTTTPGKALDAVQGKALSDRIANIGTWQLHDTASGTTAIALPATYTELIFEAYGTNSITFTWHVCAAQLSANVKKFYAGYYKQSSLYGVCDVDSTSTSVFINQLRLNGTDYTNSATLNVYYK